MTTNLFRNFVRVDSEIDTTPFLNEVDGASHLWQADTSRQRNVRCQRNTWNIFLRAAKKPLPLGARNANDVHESRTMRYCKNFPNTLSFCTSLALQQGGTLGRATLVALLPKSKVYPHVDSGEYYADRDRYHLILRSPRGSQLTAGDESIIMQERELWVFNNKVEHSAQNFSNQIRIHLIFDIQPRERRGYFVQSTNEI